MNQRQFIILGMLIAILIAGMDFWSFTALGEASAYANHIHADADSCDRLGGEIADLQTKPPIANTTEQPVDELPRQIEKSARSLGIEEVASIDPESTVRVSETAYLEKPTSVELHHVTLSQLVPFLCQLTGEDSDLRVKSLRLVTPSENAQSDRWNAEVILTYLIYSPEESATLILPRNNREREDQ